MAVVGDSILHVWSLGTGFTGLEGTMSAAGTYHVDASSTATAGETVTIAEIGTTGIYSITYTPTVAAAYVWTVTESTNGLTFDFDDTVLTAASTATISNAYCALADEVAYSRLGAASATTSPTETQVTGYLVNRAAELYAIMSESLGTKTPGPSGYGTTVDTGTDAGLALSKMLLMANAYGGAMDRVQAASAGESPNRSDRVNEMMEVYYGFLIPNVKRLAIQYGQLTTVSAATHFTTGRVVKGSFSSRDGKDLQFNGSTEW